MTPAALLAAFKQMSPRGAQVIERAALDGLSLGQLAQLYGVTEQAAAILVMRSVRELDAALAGRASSPLPFETELATMPEFLEGWATRSIVGPATTLVASTAMREELKAALTAAANAEAATPRRRHERWIRWAAIALIVAASAYLYWRDLARP
jgi:hypothetical protein